MPDTWSRIRLGDVSRMRRGISYAGTEVRDTDAGEGVPFITIKCFKKGGGFSERGLKQFSGVDLPDYRLPTGALLIANTDVTRDADIIGAPLTVPSMDQSPLFSMDVSQLLVDERKIDNRFLFYLLCLGNVRRYMKAHSAGSTVLHLNAQDVPDLLLDLPSLAEQRQIAHILDTLDTQIRRTEALIAKLEQIKQGLLTDLLTRGVDENGQLRPPPEEASELYKDSPLGWIPIEWNVSNVTDEFTIDSGFTLGNHRRPAKNPHPYLRVANVYRDRLSLQELAYLEANPAELAGKTLAVGDLLIVEGHANPDEIGRCAMATESVAGFTFQNHLFRVRARRMAPQFALLWLNSYQVRAYWRATCATSSGLNTINRTKLLSAPVVVPPDREQHAIAATADIHSRRIAREYGVLEKLGTCRSGLTDDLLTGRVRVTPLLDKPTQATG